MRLKKKSGFVNKKVKVANIEYEETDTKFGHLENPHEQETKAKGDYYGRKWYPVPGAGKKGHK